MTIEDFKADMLSGKIKAMAMLDCSTYAIRSNKYAYMQGVKRYVKTVTDNMFTLETQTKDGTMAEAEGYYQAFKKYTGDTVSNDHVIYAIFR